MGRIKRTREGDNSQALKAFIKQELIIMHCMISMWWKHFMAGLVHYMIRSGEVEQVMVIITSLTYLVYTYSRLRINNPPYIIVPVINLMCIPTCTYSSISWTI